MKHIIMALAFTMLLIGCGNNSTSPENTNSPFTLHQVGALKKQTSAIKVIQPMSEQVYDFDLDTVATTTSFYFIPTNSGTSAITGMKLTFDNPKFAVSPDTITTLSAPDKNTGVTPLIKVTIIHGKEALGIGYDDMLSANQYGTLTISGENDDGKFSVNYTMHVYAKRMVITIKYDSIVVKDIASNGSTEVIPLFYAEFDSSSAGCYIDVDAQTITSNTRMIRYSDLAANMTWTEYLSYGDSVIGSWTRNQQNKAIGALVDNYNTIKSQPVTNCPTYVQLYDGTSYVIPY